MPEAPVTTTAMLEVRGLNAWYGESHVLHGVDFDVRMAPRRAGDPAALVADSTRIRELLGWTPAHADLFCQWPTLERLAGDALRFNAPDTESAVRMLNGLSAMSSMLR